MRLPRPRADSSTRPFCEPLPVQAASFLTPAGGYGSARVEHFRFHEIISFKAAYTQVMGTRHTEKDVDIFDTLAQAVIEDLNILGVVTADRIVARITSRHRSDAASPEMAASPFGSRIDNLKIAGQTGCGDGQGGSGVLEMFLWWCTAQFTYC